ncbi:MAG TPA: CHASE3 domain-containing protein [Chthoniobacterales bacterium]|nr:CHASE3 domain-containing protein [Chthoniobacterales bacterium]
MHWTISKKILAGYGITILVVIALCTSVFINLRALRAEFDDRTQSRDKLEALATLDILLRDAETGQRGFVITGNETYLEPNRNAHSALTTTLDRLKELCVDDTNETVLVSNLRRDIKTKLDEMDATITLRRDKGFEAAAAVVNTNQGKQLMDDMRTAIGSFRSDEAAQAKASLDRVNDRIETLNLSMEVIAPVAILLTLAIGIITARSISRPLEAITGAAGQIARGEIEVQVTPGTGEDEVSRLSRSFEQMVRTLKTSAATSARIAAGDLTVEVKPQSSADLVGRSQADMIAQLSALISQVQQSGVQVNSSSVEIAAVAKQQQATASEVASTTTEISSTAREMSATSTELLKTADHVSMIASETAILATQGKEKLNRMEKTIQQISEASGTVTSRLGVMNEKAGNINAVITTITKVADQTNLLSLNAAIEAEKAGEYGKGFSVVATEIRRLADQTAASSSDIERIVKELLSAVSAGVMGMDKFAEEVRRGATEIGETRHQLDDVIGQVQSLAPSVETLHEGMRAQTQGAEQISDALSQLGEAARQTADSIRDSGRAVEQLNDASRGLQGAISQFKIRS